MGKILILVILTLGAISKAWATPNISSSCRFLILSDDAITAEVTEIAAQSEKAETTEELRAAIADLEYAAKTLFGRSQEAEARKVYVLMDQLYERIAEIESHIHVVQMPNPISVLSVEDLGKASPLMSKIEAKVYEVVRLDGKNSLAAYVTELTIYTKPPYDVHFSENFHNRFFSPIAKAFDSDAARLRFDRIIDYVLVDDKRIHERVGEGIFKALVFNQPTASGLIETTTYQERMNDMAYMPFDVALEADFYPGDSKDFGAMVVEQVLQMANIDPQSVIKTFPKR